MEFNEKFLNSKEIMVAFIQQARAVQCYELGITPKTPNEIIAKKLVSYGNMGQLVYLRVNNVTLYSFMSEKEMLKILEKANCSAGLEK